MRILVLLGLVLASLSSFSQTFFRLDAANDGQTINFTCPITNTRFADDGANSTHYSNGVDRSITFCAPSDQLLKFDFGCASNLTIERIDPTDTLFIYDGASTAAPLLYAVTGNPSNSDRLPYFDESSDFVFLSPSNCITFRLKSDASNNNDGWDACVTCVAPINCNNNEPASDLFGGAPYICNLNGYCGTTSGDFGADFPVDLNPSGGNCPSAQNFLGTIENNSWLRFIADSTDVEFTFNVTLGGACLNGIQTAIFSYDGSSLTRLSDCNLSDGSHAGTFQLTASGLTVGDTYYIMTDGNAGDICDYTINADLGVTILDAGADQEVCPSDPVTLVATGPASATYVWNSLDGAVVNAAGASQTFNPDSTTTYVVSVTGGGACEDQEDTVVVSTDCSTLLVDLLGFRAELMQSQVLLSWETAYERDNEAFEVQRSADALNWEKLLTVAGAGNSNQMTEYEAWDEQPYTGHSFYRLMQRDYDGNETYSAIVEVEMQATVRGLKLYPNPSESQITVEGEAEDVERLLISDMLGKRLNAQIPVIEQSRGHWVLDVSSLPAGLYVVKSEWNAARFYKK